jgi:hypothetical protein
LFLFDLSKKIERINSSLTFGQAKENKKSYFLKKKNTAIIKHKKPTIWFHRKLSVLKNIKVKITNTEIEITSWMILSCHILKGPPLVILPILLAGTIKLYSHKAMPQLITIANNIPTFLNFKCPYQAIVIKVLEARSNKIVMSPLGIDSFI